MSRLLQRPALGDAPRPVGAPDPAADPFTRARVDQAAAEAFERGVAEGRAAAADQARRSAEEAAQRVAAALAAAVDEVRADLADLRAAQALADAELACRIAEVVVGREPGDGGRALLARCQEALAALDDRPLTVRAAPEDAAVLRAGLGESEDVEVVEDGGLAPGEAVLRGRWGRADLTREAAWQLVRQALGIEAVAGGAGAVAAGGASLAAGEGDGDG